MLPPFPTVQRISAYDLLGMLSILAEPNFTDKAAEHIRKIPPNKIGALDKFRAYRTAVKLQAAGAWRIFRARVKTAILALAEIFTLPPITDHCQTPLDRS